LSFKKRNKLARKHGAYASLLDARTTEAQLIKEIQARLIDALGGNPSPQESLIIQRAVFKAVRCMLAEKEILAREGSITLQNDYLKWSRELRLDLKTLGLGLRHQEKVLDLGEYLAQKGEAS
jgi:hypothetical protein